MERGTLLLLALQFVSVTSKIACPSPLGFNLTGAQSVSGYFVTVVGDTAYMAAI